MSNGSGDPFGMGPAGDMLADMERDMDDVSQEGAKDAPAAVPVKKTVAKGGVPKSVLLAGGIGALVIMVMIVVAIAALGGRGRANAERAAEAQRAAALQEVQAGALVKNDLAVINDQLRSLQGAVKQLQERMERSGAASQEMQNIAQRQEALDRAVASIRQDMVTVQRRSLDARSFESDMYIREDAQIVSIGNGVARVRDKQGVEHTLRRGDKWEGLRVVHVRADRWQVTLSDGSVFL